MKDAVNEVMLQQAISRVLSGTKKDLSMNLLFAITSMTALISSIIDKHKIELSPQDHTVCFRHRDRMHRHDLR